MIKTILNWILSNATFKLYASPTPIGKRLGGHDVAGVTDSYVILHIQVRNTIIFLGHFQTS